MTDPFEEALRGAFRDLDPGPSHIPGYQDAWRRGRRRRLVKRSALAAAGALVFIAALTVNLGRLPGSDSDDVDDVALEVQAATPAFEPTPVTTTAALEQPTEPAATTPLPVPAAPTETPTPAAVESPTVVVPPPTSVPAAPTPTPQPTASPPAVATPEPTRAPATPTVTAAATPTSPAGVEATDIDPDGTTGHDETPTPDPNAVAESTITTPEPAIAATAPTVADAVLTEPAARSTGLACEISGSDPRRAVCDLLSDYACADQGDALPGYVAIDADQDGTVDTCQAAGSTRCDTTGDGFGDTFCIIELAESNEPADSGETSETGAGG